MKPPDRVGGECRRAQPGGAPSIRGADGGDTDSPALDFGESSGGAELHRRLGLVLRQLNDALVALGMMPRLVQSARDLPEARGRLEWIVHRCGEAANRTLSAVEQAQAERERIDSICRRLGADVDPVVAELRQASARIGAELSDILLAQDFHDLTGQVVAQVLALVLDLEASLLDLLRRSAPDAQRPVATPRAPAADRVRDQREVDELLSDLGF